MKSRHLESKRDSGVRKSLRPGSREDGYPTWAVTIIDQKDIFIFQTRENMRFTFRVIAASGEQTSHGFFAWPAILEVDAPNGLASVRVLHQRREWRVEIDH
jgi:hypothetical protein